MENLTGGTPPVRYLPCVVPCKLYFAYGQKTPAEVVQDWMNSPGHCATLLGNYSEYGNKFGVGVYKSGGKIYWSQEFVGWDANA